MSYLGSYRASRLVPVAPVILVVRRSTQLEKFVKRVAKDRLSLVLSILVVVQFLAFPAATFGQTTEYSLRSLTEELYTWGVEATGYNKPRWKQERDLLQRSVIGSAITIDGFVVHASGIGVVREERRPIAVYQIGTEAPHRESGGLSEIWNAPCVDLRLTSEYEIDRVCGLLITIKDSTLRLAVEISGRAGINLSGRVVDAGIRRASKMSYATLQLVIDIGSWRTTFHELPWDSPPRCRREPPEYTQTAIRARIQGTIILLVAIDEGGRVGGVSVIKGLPHGLTESTVTAARKMMCEPATKDGKPIAVSYKIIYNLRLP